MATIIADVPLLATPYRDVDSIFSPNVPTVHSIWGRFNTNDSRKEKEAVPMFELWTVGHWQRPDILVNGVRVMLKQFFLLKLL